MVCRHAGVINIANEKSFECYINYDKNFILINDIYKYLYMNILKREK